MVSQIKLYGMPVSTCTQKVMMALKEKKLAFEFIPINVLKMEQKTPEHLARHPFGKIPVLEDEDGDLHFESLAICRYIDAMHPTVGARLVPANPKQAVTVDQWTYTSCYNFYPSAQQVIFETAIKKAKGLPTDMQNVALNKEKLIPTLDIYEKHLATRDFFAGDEFSLADLAHLPYANVLQKGAPDLMTGRPALSAWFARCSSRPAWQEVMQFSQSATACH
ncbi:glutathione transferase [Powellomyces hirtus]|nr:glutathione transferase [Powellomyces hirtus]